MNEILKRLERLEQWYRCEDRSLPIDEVAEAIDAYAKLCDENQSLRTQLAEKEAEAAVMREALQLAKEVTSNGFLPNPHTKRFDMTHFDVHATIDKALSTSAGKAYIARMEEAVRLLSAVENYEGTIITEDIKWFDWRQRRETLLEQLKGGK